MSVFYTDGKWRLASGGFSEHGCCLQHLCGDSQQWWGWRYCYRQMESPCGFCGDPIPKGIQALYVMMSGEME